MWSGIQQERGTTMISDKKFPIEYRIKRLERLAFEQIKKAKCLRCGQLARDLNEHEFILDVDDCRDCSEESFQRIQHNQHGGD